MTDSYKLTSLLLYIKKVKKNSHQFIGYGKKKAVKRQKLGLTLKHVRSQYLQVSKNLVEQNISPTGNRTPASRVTGGDTDHYTIEETILRNANKVKQLLKRCFSRVVK
jgi:hypothetical protein